MNLGFEVTDAPRTLPGGADVRVPLVTVAWRALRLEHQRRAAELRDIDREARKTLETLARVAEEAQRLRAAAAV